MASFTRAGVFGIVLTIFLSSPIIDSISFIDFPAAIVTIILLSSIKSFISSKISSYISGLTATITISEVLVTSFESFVVFIPKFASILSRVP